MNKIEIKTTKEITNDEIKKIAVLFKEVFHGDMTIESFRHRYQQTPIGYSVHALLLSEDNAIVGCHHLVPFYYVFDGKKQLFAYGSGTMIKKEFRNFLTYRRLITESQKYIVENMNCTFLFGFPNENSYPVQKKGLQRQDIGDLSIFFLPLRLSAFKKSLRLLDPLVSLFSKCWLFFSNLSLSKKQYVSLVHRDYKSFNACRYNVRENVYKRVEGKDFSGYYRTRFLEGKLVAYILDVQPLTKRNFDGFVRKVAKEVESNVDGIMFVGNLPFKPMSLIKIPKKFEPKTFHFVGTIFNKEIIDERIFCVKNWEVSLVDYDLL